MDNDSYEETRLKRDESWAKWIKEGDLVPLISWNGLVISVDYPKTASLKIASTDPGLQGNRSSAGTKLAILETGAQVQVGSYGPIFTYTRRLHTLFLVHILNLSVHRLYSSRIWSGLAAPIIGAKVHGAKER